MKWVILKMKISAKGRYGLAAMIHIAKHYETGEPITIISIAEKLGISKIYLEQVFSLLKRAGLVNSIKGAQGGYQLANTPKDTTVFAILSAIELALFEKTEDTATEKALAVNQAMHTAVFDKIDKIVRETLTQVNLQDLMNETEKYNPTEEFMYFI